MSLEIAPVVSLDDHRARTGVSVVIPTRDRDEMLERAVRSVLEQDYAGPIEIIVVFDGVPVRLPETAEHEHRTVRGVSNTRTPGLAGARNTGILAAGESLVAFLDDDDRWLPHKLTRQVEIMMGDPGAVVLGTAMLVDTGRRTVRRSVAVPRLSHADFLRNRRGALHSSSLLFRRSQLIGAGMTDERLPRGYAEDTDLLLTMTRYGYVRVLEEPTIVVRKVAAESAFTGKWGDYAAALTYLLDKHPEFAGDRRGLARMRSQIAFGMAGSGQRRVAARWAARSIGGDPRAVRAWLALAVAAGVLDADRVAARAARHGRGV